MSTSWQPVSDGYLLRCSKLAGKLAIRGRAPGLRNMSLRTGRGMRCPGPLLAVTTVQATGRGPFWVRAGSTAPIRRVRSNLVDLEFELSKGRPARMHLYWGVTRTRQLDLEVLVTTVEPFEALEVLTLSQMPLREARRSEVLVRISGKEMHWADLRQVPYTGAEWLVVPRDQAAAAFSLDGRSPRFGSIAIAAPFHRPLVLCRPERQPWSYAEMSHPEDCVRIMGRVHRGTVQWCFCLFGLDLEKGVILRGRVRGVFIPRRQDMKRAEQLYRQFLAESPHLSV